MPDVIFFIFKPKNVIDKQGDFNFEVFFLKQKGSKIPTARVFIMVYNYFVYF